MIKSDKITFGMRQAFCFNFSAFIDHFQLIEECSEKSRKDENGNNIDFTF